MKHYAPFCQIIFLSSYLSYATEVYETEHIYFILSRSSTSGSALRCIKP